MKTAECVCYQITWNFIKYKSPVIEIKFLRNPTLDGKKVNLKLKAEVNMNCQKRNEIGANRRKT